MKFDALVIGGGPAGATAALLLAEAGWSVGLIEKKEFPRRKVCGEFVSATSFPLLHQLGLEEFYLSRGGPEVRRVGLYAGEAVLTSDMPIIANHEKTKWGRAFGREHLDTLLMDKVRKAKVHVWQPAEAVSVQRREGSSFCIIKEGDSFHEVNAAVLIIAHGSWEKRIDGSPSKLHKPSDLLAFKAQFTASSLSTDLMSLLAFTGGYGGMVHSDDRQVSLSCCIRRHTLTALRLQGTGVQAGELVLDYIKKQCRGVREVLSHANREDSWLAAGPIQPGIRHCYQEGSFFVGNIAGEAHPIVAEGISMALQSGWLLAQTLIEHQQLKKSLDEAGACYTKKWRKHFSGRIHAASLFAHIAMMNPKVISIFIPIIKHFPSTLTWGAKLSGKTNLIVQ